MARDRCILGIELYDKALRIIAHIHVLVYTYTIVHNLIRSITLDRRISAAVYAENVFPGLGAGELTNPDREKKVSDAQFCNAFRGRRVRARIYPTRSQLIYVCTPRIQFVYLIYSNAR